MATLSSTPCLGIGTQFVFSGRMPLLLPPQDSVVLLHIHEGECMLNCASVIYRAQAGEFVVLRYAANAWIESVQQITASWIVFEECSLFKGISLLMRISSALPQDYLSLYNYFLSAGPGVNIPFAFIEQTVHLANARPAHPQAPSHLVRLRVILETEYTEQFTLEMLASRVGMSKFKMVRDFKTFWGTTPIDYLRNVRLARSMDLLECENLSVADISEKVGFNSLPYFTKCFKNMYGITPGTQRKNLRDRDACCKPSPCD